jgi:hypothetical protein
MARQTDEKQQKSNTKLYGVTTNSSHSQYHIVSQTHTTRGERKRNKIPILNYSASRHMAKYLQQTIRHRTAIIKTEIFFSTFKYAAFFREEWTQQARYHLQGLVHRETSIPTQNQYSTAQRPYQHKT